MTALNQPPFALTSSGTMSLHCALAGIPGAVTYRADPLFYLLAPLMPVHDNDRQQQHA